MTVANILKLLANELGARLPRSFLSRVGSLLNYFYTGKWMNEHGFNSVIRVQNRAELIEVLAEPIKDKEVLYLEFGVWKGETITKWSNILRNPRSRLHGFDSFEGLSESWDEGNATGRPLRQGHFSTAGKPR
jgi:hypothetical protein